MKKITKRKFRKKMRISAESWISALLAVSCAVLTAWLFYDRLIFAVILLPFFYAAVLRLVRNERKERRERRIRKEFLSGILLIRDSLRAGYALENSVKVSLRELTELCSEKSEVVHAWRLIIRKTELSMPVEQAFSEFADEADIEEIRDFAEAVRTVKRSGGQLTGVVNHVSELLTEEEEAGEQIRTALAQGKLEQRIMSLMPALILLYIRISSPSMLASMYGTVVGCLVMTGCLIVYAVAVFWGQKIMRISV